MGHGAHVQLVGAQRDHGGRRGALERDQGDDVPGVLPQEVDDAERRLAVTPLGADEQVEPLHPADPLQHLVDGDHVVVADRTAGAVPVGDEHAVEEPRQAVDDLLSPVEQDRRLLDLDRRLVAHGALLYMRYRWHCIRRDGPCHAADAARGAAGEKTLATGLAAAVYSIFHLHDVFVTGMSYFRDPAP